MATVRRTERIPCRLGSLGGSDWCAAAEMSVSGAEMSVSGAEMSVSGAEMSAQSDANNNNTGDSTSRRLMLAAAQTTHSGGVCVGQSAHACAANDANWLAERLGVSPPYMTEVKTRWSTAAQLYSTLIKPTPLPHSASLTTTTTTNGLNHHRPIDVDASTTAPPCGRSRMFTIGSPPSTPTKTTPTMTSLPASTFKRHSLDHGRAAHHSQPRPILRRHELLPPEQEFPPATPPSSLTEAPPSVLAKKISLEETAPTSSESSFFGAPSDVVPVDSPASPQKTATASSSGGSSCNELAKACVPPNLLELEAIAAIHELSFAVDAISVSEMLPRTADILFVNVTTLEGLPFCLELTQKGWRVTSFKQDCMNGDYRQLALHTRHFESPFALMDQVSPMYRDRLGERLAARLRCMELDDELDENDEDDTLRRRGVNGGCVAPASSYVGRVEDAFRRHLDGDDASPPPPYLS